MKGSRAIFILILMIGSVVAEPLRGTLQFFNGSTLHGALVDLNEETLVWQFDGARDPIRFEHRNVAWVRFDQPEGSAVPLSPNHRIEFRNGDIVYGTLLDLDDEKLRLRTWQGDELEAARSELVSLVNLPEGFEIVYEGPTESPDWQVATRVGKDQRIRQLGEPGPGNESWRYSDGAFITEDAGTLGRDFNLGKSVSVEFDIDWTGYFGLNVGLFSNRAILDDFRSHTCRISIVQGTASVQTISDAGRITQLGRISLPEMIAGTTTRFAIRVFAERRLIQIYVNGVLEDEWIDKERWTPKGKAIVFSSSRSNSMVQIRNMRITTWDDVDGEPLNLLATEESDFIQLANDDQTDGIVSRLESGSLFVESPFLDLEIPFDRVSYFTLAQAGLDVATMTNPGHLRAFLLGGGHLTFDPALWGDEAAEGISRGFGTLRFNPNTIRELQFNIGRQDPVRAGGAESGEVIWDLNE